MPEARIFLQVKPNGDKFAVRFYYLLGAFGG